MNVRVGALRCGEGSETGDRRAGELAEVLPSGADPDEESAAERKDAHVARERPEARLHAGERRRRQGAVLDPEEHEPVELEHPLDRERPGESDAAENADVDRALTALRALSRLGCAGAVRGDRRGGVDERDQRARLPRRATT